MKEIIKNCKRMNILLNKCVILLLGLILFVLLYFILIQVSKANC